MHYAYCVQYVYIYIHCTPYTMELWNSNLFVMTAVTDVVCTVVYHTNLRIYYQECTGLSNTSAEVISTDSIHMHRPQSASGE